MSLFNFFEDIRRSIFSNKPTKPILDVEMASDETSFWKSYPTLQYSPDDLLSKKKIGIFDEMMKDYAIESAINMLKTVRLSSGWELLSASDDEKDIEVKNFCQYCLENIEGSFEDDLREILGACEMGISISEIIWRKIENGKYAGKIGLKAIKSKNPKYFNVYVDDFDNIMPEGIIPLTGKNRTPLPTEKFIIYSFNKKYENVFGTSRLRTLYQLWFMKQVLLKVFGVYLEKYGHPISKIKYPQNITKEAKQKLIEIVKQLRFETGIVIPQEIDFEIMPSESKGSDIHLQAIRFIDEKIREVILGQSLTSEKGQTGSYALGKVHFDIFTMYIEQLGRDVAEKAINEQLLRRLVYYNFGDVDIPKFSFKPLLKEDMMIYIDKYYAGVKDGILKPTPEDEAKIRDILKFPQRKDNSLSENKEVSIAFSEKLFTGVRRRTFTEYEKAVDFKNIVSIQDMAVDNYVVDVAGLLRDSIDEIYKDIEKKRIIDEKNFAAIDKLHIKYLGDIKAKFYDMFVKMYEQGYREARKEIIEKKKSLKFQELDFRNITPTEALDYFKQKGYYATQVEKDFVSKIIKNNLFNAIKNGKSIKEFINDTEDALAPYFNKGLVDEDYLTSHRLETIFRTNVNEAFNEGRKAFFEAPEMQGYVEAYQYSAILDDRVRPNHAEMDGRIYAITNSVWNIWTPPNGYNCRCLLIPITADEEWEEDNPIPASLRPDEGFK